jgi:DNA-directed RNA polymerase subunit RPC12/RpoP
MAYRIIPTAEKVKAVLTAIEQINVAQAARESGMNEDTLRYNLWKVVEALPEVLVNRKSGPKSKAMVKQGAARPDYQRCPHRQGKRTPSEERPQQCPHCGSETIWKNGTYQVINWLLFLLTHWLGGRGPMTTIQRYLCAHCRREIHSQKKLRMTQAREKAQVLMGRLLAFGEFKAHLSHRLSQALVSFVYGVEISLGSVHNITQAIGKKARQAMHRLGDCRQKEAKVMMGDETFPKIKGQGKDRGTVVTCDERGLIRSVKCVMDKVQDLAQGFGAAIGRFYRPKVFVSDYDRKYPPVVHEVLGEDAIHLPDLVHTQRHIHRCFQEAVRDTQLHLTRQDVSDKQRKEWLSWKKRLLRKRLTPYKWLMLKAFKPGYESVGMIYIEGTLQMLAEDFPVQTEGVRKLHKKLSKFLAKYGWAINYQWEHDEIPSTTNMLESKNSILKPFSKVAKSFQDGEACEKKMNGVALMENFDVKSRGKNKGTSAITRAGINLDDLGGRDFYQVVGLDFQ